MVTGRQGKRVLHRSTEWSLQRLTKKKKKKQHWRFFFFLPAGSLAQESADFDAPTTPQGYYQQQEGSKCQTEY